MIQSYLQNYKSLLGELAGMVTAVGGWQSSESTKDIMKKVVKTNMTKVFMVITILEMIFKTFFEKFALSFFFVGELFFTFCIYIQ